MLDLLLAAVMGYLLGSIPMGVLLSKMFDWPDPRTTGSGHTGARNTGRGGGTPAFILVMLSDISKGAAAALLAGYLFDNPWALPAAGIMAVIGHNWPVWLGFKGGMGLAVTGGVLFATAPLVVLIFCVIWLGLKQVIKHTARTTVITAPTIVPISLWFLGADWPVWVAGTGGAVLIALRTAVVDWNKESRDDPVVVITNEEPA